MIKSESFAKQQILDSSKLKELAEDNSKFEKTAENSPKGKKTLLEKEKLLISCTADT